MLGGDNFTGNARWMLELNGSNPVKVLENKSSVLVCHFWHYICSRTGDRAVRVFLYSYFKEEDRYRGDRII